MTAETQTGPVLAADGTPLKKSLARALRLQKMRALMLIAPLLVFILLSFILPIVDMLFRSVENQIVANTLPYTVEELSQWDRDSQELPDEAVFQALYFDFFLATEGKRHTRLGSRLNYEQTGMSSAFRGTGRKVDDIGKKLLRDMSKNQPDLGKAAFWYEMMHNEASSDSRLFNQQQSRVELLNDTSLSDDIGFSPSGAISAVLPLTSREYTAFAFTTVGIDNKEVAKTKPYEAVLMALLMDLKDVSNQSAISAYQGPGAEQLQQTATWLQDKSLPVFTEEFADINKQWGSLETWQTISVYSPRYTEGYFLNAVDLQKTLEGPAARPENEQIYIKLFNRTMFMSLVITFSCILLAYPIAWLLANLPMRTSNLLLILVLLPFWTSLLVRTSAWKVMLQQQGVINDVLVWLGIVADDARLIMINNQLGTIIAMTHILLPFMILPMYSVMQTINPSYVRASRSMGASNWTTFWRVYFPLSVPGIGAGSILVFILAIGYYITPEIVGGTTGTFISNRIAFHISSSLNWGLGAALGAILLVAVLILYWAYDKIVGIDNVKLG